MSAFITRAWLQNADNKFSAFASPTFISDAALEAINRSSTLREQMYSYANNANFDKVRLDPNSTAASFNFPDSDKQVKGFISIGANFFVSDFRAISILAHELGHYAYEQPNAVVARARAAAYADKDAVAYEQACHLTEGYANYNVGVVLLEVAANGGNAAWAGSPAVPNFAFVVRTFRDFVGMGQQQTRNKCRPAMNKLASSQVNTMARSQFNLKLARKTALASCLLAATSIALAQPVPQAVESVTLTSPPTAQALALGDKFVDIAWTIVNTIPLTDATAIYRQFGIKDFRAGFRSNHVDVTPSKSSEPAMFGMTSIRLTPFLRSASVSDTVPPAGASIANEARLSIRLMQGEACVTINRVRAVFGNDFIVSSPRLVAPSCAVPGSTCIFPKSRFHGYAGVIFQRKSFFDGNEGGIGFNFEYQQCADTISIGTRSPE